jgi:heme exporter protein A
MGSIGRAADRASMTDLDPSTPPLLAARGLCFARDGEPIFGPLDLAVAAGTALVVEGANGAGKTTLLRVLAGLLEASEGEIRWQGEALADGRRVPGSIALLGHHLGLKADLSPLENLRFRLALSGLRPGNTPEAALRSVGLEGFEDAPVRTLSAGQRKRTALAALLLAPAALWLLDEPYANLDREGQRVVDRMLEAHCHRGGAAVFTSHGLFTPGLSRTAKLALGGRA